MTLQAAWFRQSYCTQEQCLAVGLSSERRPDPAAVVCEVTYFMFDHVCRRIERDAGPLMTEILSRRRARRPDRCRDT
ncbi:hypothetical protein DOTSEDRAFT_67682 [Dothistroma septosporum NZE10]|uniref:Uncharacterized protein n=1 Tax=Dothistroma septosporum (strain NZE10 / CBS 128990) TaxID=675120 RepID=N1PYX8_DOTSN|nr:hypothetical protein DOTSEDRAFT_67682 [Dothistroma septosporum NZE10]